VAPSGFTLHPAAGGVHEDVHAISSAPPLALHSRRPPAQLFPCDLQLLAQPRWPPEGRPALQLG
jgi:hypothetical protein